MKKWTALFLALILVLSLFGCAAPKEEDPWEKFRKGPGDTDEGFVGIGKDIKDMKDPLVICMDIEFAHEPMHTASEVLNEFLLSLEQTGGLSDVVINYLPESGPERETKLDRLRVEIMAGGGPDVFIMNCSTWGIDSEYTPVEDPLFLFPEMSMESGLFLPLDDYIENNTQFADWDKLTQPVLAAGRHERDGQVIVPLTYTLPVLVYKKPDVDLDLTGAFYTWEDMLKNPEISTYTSRFADCSEPYFGDGMEKPTVTVRGHYLPYVFGQVADYKNEELTFTEEELLDYVNFILDNAKAIDPATEPPLSYTTDLGSFMTYELSHELRGNTSDGMTMIPMYTEDGGVSAMISAWAAINRNTDKPEEAYTVIDMLMSEHMQRNNLVYSSCFIFTGNAIPMHEDLLQPGKEFRGIGGFTLEEINHKELCEVRSQITEAQFRNKLCAELSYLLSHCHYGLRGVNAGPEFGNFTSVEEEVHKTYEKMQRMLKG